MKTLAVYSAIRIVLLCAVVVNSMGVTTVVKYCSMSETSECCCAPLRSVDQLAGARRLSIDGQHPTCFSVTVLGGLHDTTATINSENAAKSSLVDGIVSAGAINGLMLPNFPLVSPHIDDPSPPGVGIFILTSSFLI
jgi:hypothetical protein